MNRRPELCVACASNYEERCKRQEHTLQPTCLTKRTWWDRGYAAAMAEERDVPDPLTDRDDS